MLRALKLECALNHDAVAVRLWRQTFGDDVLIVPWRRFIARLFASLNLPLLRDSLNGSQNSLSFSNDAVDFNSPTTNNSVTNTTTPYSNNTVTSTSVSAATSSTITHQSPSSSSTSTNYQTQSAAAFLNEMDEYIHALMQQSSTSTSNTSNASNGNYYCRV